MDLVRMVVVIQTTDNTPIVWCVLVTKNVDMT
jgi:hypothetical protein